MGDFVPARFPSRILDSAGHCQPKRQQLTTAAEVLGRTSSPCWRYPFLCHLELQIEKCPFGFQQGMEAKAISLQYPNLGL